MNTRKYPRTMQEAFGPYTGREIDDTDNTGYSTAWWAALGVVSVIAMIVIVVTA